MTIKNDAWIIEMCRDKGMIEPFETTQVKRRQLASDWSYPDGPNGGAVEHENFERLISYGVSSHMWRRRVATGHRLHI